MKALEAQYDDGVLRPSRKLPLLPGERVQVIVLRYPDHRRWNLARLARINEDEAILNEQGLEEWAAAIDLEDQS